MFSMTQIRERSHILLWILLFFFVLGMAVSGLVGGANILDLIIGGKNTTQHVGRIDGDPISRANYENQVRFELNRVANQGNKLDGNTIQSVRNTIWDRIIQRRLHDEKIRELGLEVSRDEIYDFLLYTPPPSMRNDLMSTGYFKKESGQFDTLAYQIAIEEGSIPDEIIPILKYWESSSVRNFIADRKLRSLYNNLGSINEEQIKNNYIKNNISCNIDYVYIPLRDIPDSLVINDKLEDDIKNRYNEKKEDYQLGESKTLEYVIFEIPKPITKDDSLNVDAVHDSINELAMNFVYDAEDYSFKKAVEDYNINKIDTVDTYESFGENSKLSYPLRVNNARDVVRFAFDNSIGSLSDTIRTASGIAVFHIIGSNKEGYRPLKNVKRSIESTLLSEYKNNYATKIISSISNDNNWENISNDSNGLIKYSNKQQSTIGNPFPQIGTSNQLKGTLIAMDPGEYSGIIETPNAILKVKMLNKDSIIDSLYQKEYTTIKTQLLNTEKNQGYNNWFNNAREDLDIDDYRSEIY